jgi:hypothetical protein
MATGVPHGTITGGSGPDGPGDIPDLPPARPRGGWAACVRLRVTATSPGRPVFAAIGPADRVAAYLSGTAYTTATGIWVPVRLAGSR